MPCHGYACYPTTCHGILTSTYSLLQAELLSLPLPITYTTTYSLLQAELLSLREKVARQEAHAAYLTAENASLRRDKVGSK